MDKFEEALEVWLKKLQECQEQKNKNSCLKCENLLTCTTRKEYVDAVYQSMSKGHTGGFEF